MSPTKGFCIFCGEYIPYNTGHPTCIACGGPCSANSRSSSTDQAPTYCHACGDPAFISMESPLCGDCERNNH
ncbi:MAG: hypothetical protein ACTSUE_13725 [Promethearchaeota archaeon]